MKVTWGESKQTGTMDLQKDMVLFLVGFISVLLRSSSSIQCCFASCPFIHLSDAALNSSMEKLCRKKPDELGFESLFFRYFLQMFVGQLSLTLSLH